MAEIGLAPELIASGAALAAAVIAAAWPTLRTWQHGRRFVALISRELEAVGPDRNESEDSGKPWWEYLTRRFIHEELVARGAVQENRDFLLGLRPTIVYRLSQLWIAFEKRNSSEWLEHLSELAKERNVKSDRLDEAVRDWTTLIGDIRKCEADHERTSTSDRTDESVERVPGLFEARLSAYQELLADIHRATSTPSESNAGQALSRWYEHNHLLLSEPAGSCLDEVRQQLAVPNSSVDLGALCSRLRAELKIDIGVRDARQRGTPIEQQRSFPSL